MHEIKIYGYISNVAEQEDKEVSLLDVQNQLSLADGKPIICRINSHGGDAEEGFAIYYELRRYAKQNNVKVKTFAESRLGSIATIIFLAGDERELTTDLQPFVHKALFDTEEELTEEQKNSLAVLNTRLANHYAQHTDLTFDEAYELMDNDTWIPTEMALKMRFATSIEKVLRPVALKRFNTNKNENTMNKKTQTIYNASLQFVKKLMGAVNKIVTSADGKELDFYELEDDAVVKVGDKAYYDGMDADGSFIMPDGETYVFIAGELTEIQSEDVTDTEALAEANATIALLTEQLETVTNKAQELATQNSAKDALISGYKASSKPAQSSAKDAPKPATPQPQVTEASKAVLNLNKHLTKK